MKSGLPDPKQLERAIERLRGAPCKCRFIVAPLCSSCQRTEGLLDAFEDHLYEHPIDGPVHYAGDDAGGAP